MARFLRHGAQLAQRLFKREKTLVC